MLRAFESVEEAKAAFPDFRAEVKSGSHGVTCLPDRPQIVATETASVTIAEYVEAYWDSLHASCGATTIKTNGSSYRSHVKPFFGPKTIAAITEADCEDFAASMKTNGKAPCTTNLALRFLRKVLHHARRRKVRPDVPESFHFAKEDLLKLEMSDPEQIAFFAAFDDQEGFQRYLRETQGGGKIVRSSHFGFKERSFGGGLRPDGDAAKIYFQRYQRSRLIFTAAIDIGYRETDLRLLKRTAVDLKKGLVTIITKKTGKRATVALSDRCAAAIVTAMSHEVTSSEYVFVTDDGKPFSESTLRRHFAIAKRLAGITRRCRLNDLRHSFASNLASEGLSLLDIRDALGHTTVRMSERYAKPNEQSLERMREALNRRVSGLTSDRRSVERKVK